MVDSRQGVNVFDNSEKRLGVVGTGSYYDAKSNTLTFDPTKGFEFGQPGNEERSSPAIALMHELGHADRDINEGVGYDQATAKKEEQDVNNMYETPAARKKGEPVRVDYRSSRYYNAESPTSRKKKEEEKL